VFSNLLADLVLLLHFAFVLFAVFGGLLVLRRRWVAWLHVPAFVWAVLINLIGWVCPLTPLEKSLRVAAGGEAYEGGFVRHYIAPLIYPEGAGPELGLKIGTVLLVWNLAIYGWIFFRTRR
jgi:hypothetical protein